MLLLKQLAKKPQNGKLTPVWKNGIEGILDAYLGELPSDIEDFNFTYNGKQYNPKSFSKSLGLNMDDYISITSFSHHPFYSQFVLEVQDNWAMQSSYNLPLDEFMNVMEQAIMKAILLVGEQMFQKKVLAIEMLWQLFLKMNQPSKNLERIVKDLTMLVLLGLAMPLFLL